MGQKISEMVSLAAVSVLGPDEFEVARSASSTSYRFSWTNLVLALKTALGLGTDVASSTAFIPSFTTAGVAMTMATALGEFSIIGKRCFFSLYGTLTTKGGGGGDSIAVVLPAGLPASKNVAGLNALVDWKSNALTLGAASTPKAYLAANSRTINLQLNSVTGAPTTNANLSNSQLNNGGTDFFISGSYPID